MTLSLVTDPSENRRALIEQGRAAAQREGTAKWELGDLALAYAPMGEPGVHSGADALLREFAEAIDVELSALREYRRAANAWPATTRVVGASWSVYRELASQANRFEIIKSPPTNGRRWTVTTARARVVYGWVAQQLAELDAGPRTIRIPATFEEVAARLAELDREADMIEQVREQVQADRDKLAAQQ